MAPPPLPDTTPAAFAAYLNAHFDGDNGQPGGTVASLNEPGSTLGDQWLSWYQSKSAGPVTPAVLKQYEEAFIVLWENANLGSSLKTGLGGGIAGIGAGIQGIGAGLTTPWAPVFNFLKALESPGLWIRVGEVLAGLILIWTGVSGMTAVPGPKAVTGTIVRSVRR